MRTTLPTTELADYTARQLSHQFPDRAVSGSELHPHVTRALERVDHCFAHIRLKYFFDGTQSVFNHLNTDQYAMYLYLLSNGLHRAGADPSLASKAYALNKALHAIDVFYEIELPDIFAFQHPVGTVIGRGKFSNYFFVYQRCSIGSALSGAGPTFGEGVVMFGGAAVIGACTVGPNSWLSVNTTVMDQSVPGGCAVFGRSPDLVIKPTRRDVVREMFLRS